MPSVQFFQTVVDGQALIGEVSLDKTGKVVTTLPEGLRDSIDRVYIGRRVYTPKDGVRWLKVLPVKFSGAYVRAQFRP